MMPYLILGGLFALAVTVIAVAACVCSSAVEHDIEFRS